mmetsp:Transcript_7928/g.16548  ORF Transcript_7928/g.16548 Transcript_7928/m.16548 type:complete len:388 (+) Transcript_7928:178-1341(+)
MSDDDYDDDAFEQAPPSKSPVVAAKSALMAASAAIEKEERKVVSPPLVDDDAIGDDKGKAKTKTKAKGGLPSAAVIPKKRRKKKTKKKKDTPESPRKGSDIAPYKSRIWNSKVPGFKNGRSNFTKSVELMKAAGFEDEFSTGGTRVASSLMHVCYSGDPHVADLEKILKGGAKKKKKKADGRRGYDSDDYDSEDELDDIEKKVIGWTTMRAGKQWKCDLAEKDEQGWTCMHWAASRGQVSVLEALIKADRKRLEGLRGSDDIAADDQNQDEDDHDGGDSRLTPLCNVRDDLFGWTPLFLAVIEMHLEAVECLLEGGANPNQKDDLGETCLDCVMKKAKGTKRGQIRSVLKQYMDGEEGVDFSSDSSEEESEEERSSSASDSSVSDED